MNILLWLAPVFLPLLSAAALALRPGPRTSWLLVFAPLPAAVLAVAGDLLPPPHLGWLLLGVELSVDEVTRLLLLLTSLVWAVAGAYARTEAESHRGYAVLWLLALTGNIALLVAADAATFYGGFVVMTLAAYGLVVHHRTAAAQRAGRVYIVLAILGETAILSALLIAVAEAPSMRLDDVALAVAASAHRDLLVGLLLVGFGIKAGVFGLHMWLPLAHPAAPFPASAVLSGAMIKAGLLGWARLLPIGEVALPGWSVIVVTMGVLTAFAGVFLGLTQRDPKVVLAYSSISQMGLITVLVGVALGVPEVAPVALAGAAVYALHHGLAKAALFLGVGLVRRTGPGFSRRFLLAGIIVAAASLTGLPATSGAFAKAWLKHSVDLAGLGEGLGLALSLAAAGTTVLMVRLLLLLRRPSPEKIHPEPLVAWSLLLVAVVTVTAVLPARLLTALDIPPGAASIVLWDSVWPVLLGLVVAYAAVIAMKKQPSLTRLTLSVPEGDLVVVGEVGIVLARRGLGRGAKIIGGAQRAGIAVARASVRWLRGRHIHLDRFEAWTTRRRTGGAMAALVAFVLLLTLTLPGQ